MDIKASGLHVGYGEYLVVQELDISLPKGAITTIIGPNGSGKSTVLKALTRLLRYQKGQVLMGGRDLQEYGGKELARRVGVLPQRHSAPPDFSVKDLVGYGRLPYQSWYKRNNAEDERIIEWAMRATGVYDMRDKSINACSGGEAQRVWIATVLAQQPEVLFLDEPTTYLDIAYQIDTMHLVKKLNRKSGIGVVMVLHDIGQAMEISDYIVVVKDGRKYSEGTPAQVITPQMMKDVYNVDCDIVNLPGRSRPLLLFGEIY